MDISTAILATGAKIRTSKMANGIDLPASKDNMHVAYIDCGYANATDLRMLGIAYTTIADHLDFLNKNLK